MSQAPEHGHADSAESASAEAKEPAPESQVAAELQGMIREGSGMIHDLLKLLAVEGRLAGRSLALMLMLAVLTALFVVTSWVFLAATLALWMVEMAWLSLPASALVLALGNALLGLLVWLWIRHLSANLGFPAFVQATEKLLPAEKQREEP